MVFVFSIIIVLPIALTQFYVGIDFSNTGNIGDTIGGITAPFLSLMGSILVFVAFKEQIRANKLINDQFLEQQYENRLFKMFNNYNENVTRLNFTSRKSGREYNNKNVFPVLYQEFGRLVDEIKNFNKEKNIILSDTISSDFEKYLKSKSRNTNIDNWLLLDISYIIFFYGVGKTGRESVKSIFASKIDNKYLTELINYLSFKPAYQAVDSFFYRRWEDFYIGYEPFPEPCYDTFDKCYNGMQNSLGHYYRQLFMTIKYINDLKDKKKSYLDKWNYVKLIRSQLSNHEQIFFFINSISSLGRDWELNIIVNNMADENERLITKYDLIKNIPKAERDRLKVNEFYPFVEYEDEIRYPFYRELLEKFYYN